MEVGAENKSKQSNENTSIEKMLGKIRTGGTKNTKPAKNLLFTLSQKDWTPEQGMSFYKFIVEKYTEDDDTELMLAVSGIREGYANLNTATKRRNKYLNYLLDNEDSSSRYKDIDPETCRKAEDALLGQIASKLEEAIENGKIDSLFDEWEQKTETTGSNAENPSILNVLRKSWNSNPEYWLLAFILIVFILIFLFIYGFDVFFNRKYKDSALAVFEENKQMDRVPQIEEIVCPYAGANKTITVVLGEETSLELKVSPEKADKNDINYNIEDEDLVAMTRNWGLVGLNDWSVNSGNSTIVCLSGGNAKPVILHVTIIKRESRNSSIWEDTDLP